jgi:Protein kinase domain
MDINSPSSRLDPDDGIVPSDDTSPSDVPATAGTRAGALLERLGDYGILRELGRGGMGVVYEAERESLKVRVVLKVMRPTFRTHATHLRRFHSEARAAARLRHSNIVPVFDYGEQDGVCYYAMQMISGVGLNQMVDEVRRLRYSVEAALVSKGAETRSANSAASSLVEVALSIAAERLLTGRFAGGPPIGDVFELNSRDLFRSGDGRIAAGSEGRLPRRVAHEQGHRPTPAQGPR